MRFLAFTCAAALIFYTPALADQKLLMYGNELHKNCSGGEAERFACLMYIMGAIDVMDSRPDLQAGCRPPGVLVGQSVDIVRKYLVVHPEVRHISAVALIWQALAEAFPC